MGKASRMKGRAWEQEIAKRLKPIFPDAKRHLESQAQEANGIDLDNTGPLAVQAKCLKVVPNIPKVFAEIQHEEHEIPVVIFRVTNKGEYACFRFDDALALMKLFEEK